MSRRAAILISGRGSNMRALIEAARAPDYPAKIAGVISNVPDAAGLAFAKNAGIPGYAIDHHSFETRQAFDAALSAQLKELGAECVCLAGFMRLLGPEFVTAWEGRLLNIHPSLLPAYKGLNVHKRVLDAGEKMSGCTVHYVTADLDAGPTIAQTAVPVRQGDTPDTLAMRILEAENRLYPHALHMIAAGYVRLENGRAVFG